MILIHSQDYAITRNLEIKLNINAAVYSTCKKAELTDIYQLGIQ